MYLKSMKKVGFKYYDHTKMLCEVMELLSNFIIVIISQHIHVSKSSCKPQT